MKSTDHGSIRRRLQPRLLLLWLVAARARLVSEDDSNGLAGPLIVENNAPAKADAGAAPSEAEEQRASASSGTKAGEARLLEESVSEAVKSASGAAGQVSVGEHARLASAVHAALVDESSGAAAPEGSPDAPPGKPAEGALSQEASKAAKGADEHDAGGKAAAGAEEEEDDDPEYFNRTAMKLAKLSTVDRIRIQHMAEKLSATMEKKNETSKSGKEITAEEQKLINLHDESVKRSKFKEALVETFGTKSMQNALIIGTALFLFVFVYECVHTMGSKHDFSKPCEPILGTEREMAKASRGPVRAGLFFWLQYVGDFTFFFALCLGAMIGFIMLQQWGQTMLVDWSGEFWDKMQYWGNYGGEGQEDRLLANLAKFQWLATIVVLADVYKGYIESIFCLHVRNVLSDKFAADWLKGFAYYRMEIASLNDKSGSDNPDQRIQEDVKTHVNKTLELALGLFTNSLQIFLFTKKVWSVSPAQEPITHSYVAGWLVYAVYGYAFFVIIAMAVVGMRLEIVNMASQRTEADFRWELIAVRQHAEQIAVGGSEGVHEMRVVDKFNLVARLVWEEMFITKKMGITFAMFSQLKEIFPILFLGPAFLHGQISFGELMAASRSMGLLESALLWFPGAYPKYVSWRASTGRLVRLQEAFEKHRAAELAAKVVRQPDAAEDPKLASVQLSVWLPQSKQEFAAQKRGDADAAAEEGRATGRGPQLFQELAMSMAPGERALLVGPSGAGKTTLLRALAGAWPHAAGSITVPAGRTGAMFTTTETYAPPGKLRDAVSYPRPAKEVADEDIAAALRLVGLGHIAGTDEGLDISRYWDFALSAGMKNRLALARMVLHQPKLCVLDEPVAHLDPANRAAVLGAALGALPKDAAVLCVSHELSQEVRALFNAQYDVDPNNKTLLKGKPGGQWFTGPTNQQQAQTDQLDNDEKPGASQGNVKQLCCF
eukprot:TRINITY_DN50903_c0_g2_i1.p1 TRINITY_DN50903_c0_g2~~TRINITY_DN50903_c0_g2_i1.p1  ORF type:complete len:946 (-),score=259.19 TRINITY_DN50903_c0_g2_i1:305-3142(-)